MAATTITEYKNRPCIKCGGRGNISFFQHRKGGECFRCGASGNDPHMIEVTRPMTDEEVVAELAARGFDVVTVGIPREESDDWMTNLFLTDAEVAAQAQAMVGARLMLALM